jgi:hypothetical protein
MNVEEYVNFINPVGHTLMYKKFQDKLIQNIAWYVQLAVSRRGHLYNAQEQKSRVRIPPGYKEVGKITAIMSFISAQSYV